MTRPVVSPGHQTMDILSFLTSSAVSWLHLARRSSYRLRAIRPSPPGCMPGPLTCGCRTVQYPSRRVVGGRARGKGVLVVMNDEIDGARDVTKTNTYRVETFRSPDLGHLGYVDEDKVSFYRASTRRHTVNSEFDVSNIHEFPKGIDGLCPTPTLVHSALRSLSNRMRPQTSASASTPWSLRLSVREALKSLPVPTEVAYPSTINNTVQPSPVRGTQASR